MKNQDKDYNVEDIIDKEDISSIKEMEKPFNPKEIDIKSSVLTIDLLIKRLSAKPPEIDLYPDFQRRDDLWDTTKQSRLIESLLIRFPLPAFYFDGSDDKKWLVVDGLQRLSSLRNFIINKTLKLEHLEFLSWMDGSGYNDLTREMQRRIEESQINAYIINPGTPEAVKYNLFKRINTGGLILEPQEIRHALNQGIPARFVKELAETDEFKTATNCKVKIDRMLDRDFVTRFLSFYLNRPEDYKPDLDTFMNDTMASLKYFSKEERLKHKIEFVDSMKTAHEIFGRDAFKKIYRKNERGIRLNKALFEVWSVNIAKLKEQDRKILIDRKGEVISKFIDLINKNAKFEKSLTQSTGDKNSVLIRHSEIRKLIKEVLQNA